MRKQYYFRPSPRGLLAWDVDRLIALTRDLPRLAVPLSAVRQLDAPWFGDEEPPTWRSMIEHIRLIHAADLTYPIILSAGGDVMDGMHRVVRAVLECRETIQAVQFDDDPEPDQMRIYQ
jgi:hypothetical protein